MSRILDSLRQADLARARASEGGAGEPGGAQQPLPLGWPASDALRVLTVTSNKGGVGKTTLATNLAVYLRALDEDVPILVLTLDDQPAVDRMFALDGRAQAPDIADALRQGTLAGAIRFGQYGVHYVPSSRRVAELKRSLRSEELLREMLARSGWRGLVVVDTKSDLEMLTRNAIAAADLSLVVVKDQISVIEAERVFALLEGWGRPRESARIVLSLVDRRIRYGEGGASDVLGVLVEEVRRRGFPRFETYVSRSPKVESLYTNPEGRALSILHAAAGTPVHEQLHRLAQEVRAALEATRRERAAAEALRREVAPIAVEPRPAPALEAPPPAGGAQGIARVKRWLLQGGRLR